MSTTIADGLGAPQTPQNLALADNISKLQLRQRQLAAGVGSVDSFFEPNSARKIAAAINQTPCPTAVIKASTKINMLNTYRRTGRSFICVPCLT